MSLVRMATEDGKKNVLHCNNIAVSKTKPYLGNWL